MDWIHGIIEHTQFPLLTAFLLGLIVALHPCPLATNIAAMGYIARDVANRRRVFLNGLFYTFGRMIAYSVLGMVLIVVLRNGADMLSLGHWFSEWGERLLAPVRRYVERNCFGGKDGAVPVIAPAKLGNEAGIIGAAAL